MIEPKYVFCRHCKAWNADLVNPSKFERGECYRHPPTVVYHLGLLYKRPMTKSVEGCFDGIEDPAMVEKEKAQKPKSAKKTPKKPGRRNAVRT